MELGHGLGMVEVLSSVIVACVFFSSHSINLAATDLGSGNFKISIVVDRQVFNYFNTYFNYISPEYGYKFPQKKPIYLSHRFPDISHGFSHGFPDFPWISHGFSENSARMGIPNLRQKLFLSNEALPLHASWAEPWMKKSSEDNIKSMVISG